MVVGLAGAAAVKMIGNEFGGRRRWLLVQFVLRPRWVSHGQSKWRRKNHRPVPLAFPVRGREQY
jgi:hypothetical protein